MLAHSSALSSACATVRHGLLSAVLLRCIQLPREQALPPSVAWRGVAWRGVAWRGVAWRGVAWRGVAWPQRRSSVSTVLTAAALSICRSTEPFGAAHWWVYCGKANRLLALLLREGRSAYCVSLHCRASLSGRAIRVLGVCLRFGANFATTSRSSKPQPSRSSAEG